MPNRIYYIDEKSQTIVTQSEWIRGYPDYVKRFGGRWNASAKTWTVPITQDTNAFISELQNTWNFSRINPPNPIKNTTSIGNSTNYSVHPHTTSFTASTPSSPPQPQSASLGTSPHTLTVSQLSGLIKGSLNRAFPVPIWVTGELQGIDRGKRRMGNFFSLAGCTEDGKTLKLDAVIWNEVLVKVDEKLKNSGLELKDGLNVCLCVKVNLNSSLGTILLHVVDINTAFSLGLLLQKRLELIERLKKEGIFDRNKNLKTPLVPLKIALITSPVGQARHDFLTSLANSGFGFKVELWAASMQGTSLEESICQVLDQVACHSYDVVVITRGGGSRTDLSGFDSYEIAKRVALLPMKVYIAIGHTQDESVLDLIAQSCITPTQAGETIVRHVSDFMQLLTESQAKIQKQCQKILETQHSFFMRVSRELSLLAQKRTESEHKTLAYKSLKVSSSVEKRFASEQHTLDRFKTAIFNRSIAISREKQIELSHLHYRILSLTTRLITIKSSEFIQYRMMLKQKAERRCLETKSELERFDLELQIYNPERYWKLGLVSLRGECGQRIRTLNDAHDGELLQALLPDGVLELKTLSKKKNSP